MNQHIDDHGQQLGQVEVPGVRIEANESIFKLPFDVILTNSFIIKISSCMSMLVAFYGDSLIWKEHVDPVLAVDNVLAAATEVLRKCTLYKVQRFRLFRKVSFDEIPRQYPGNTMQAKNVRCKV